MTVGLSQITVCNGPTVFNQPYIVVLIFPTLCCSEVIRFVVRTQRTSHHCSVHCFNIDAASSEKKSNNKKNCWSWRDARVARFSSAPQPKDVFCVKKAIPAVSDKTHTLKDDSKYFILFAVNLQ